MERHVRRCGPCAAYRTRLRALQVVPPPPTDHVAYGRAAHRVERTAHLVERLAWSPGSDAPDWARYAVLAGARMQVVVAVPELMASGGGIAAHDQHHLGAWEAAFGVSLVVVAWQPERARGLLPFAAALSIGLVVTAASDAIGGRVSAMAESSHLLQVAGLVLLWIVGRAYRIRPRRRRRSTRPPSSPDAVGIADH